MGLYLNLKNDNFISYYNDDIFVDKSMIISKVNDSLNKAFVTHPRRFGKTLALSMLNAYYSKGCDSREILKDLRISKDPTFEKHLNKHNVIWIDMASVYTSIRDKSRFFDELEGNLIDSLKETSTLGRSDISFIPKDSTHIPLIIALKADSSPEDAISQIREKEYFSSLGGYKGRSLLLGISYDSKKLKHSSKVEFIEM